MIRDAFPEIVEEPAWIPPQPPEGIEVADYLGTYGAIVREEDAPPTPDRPVAPGQETRDGVMTSPSPIQARESGDLEPLDQSLQDHGDFLTADNAPVEARLPEDLGEGLVVPSEDVTVNPSGRSADAVDAIPIKDKLFYANTATDTDFLVATLPNGFETFFQLRSEASPEEHGLTFELPEGAELHGVEESGAAVIVRGGRVIGSISPTIAFDAAGQPVPVKTDVAGDRLTFTVRHRSQGFTYPILVDPMQNYPTGSVEPFDWRSGINPGAFPTDFGWASWNNAWGPISMGFGYGPYNQTNTYNQGCCGDGYQAHWGYQAPSGTYIESYVMSGLEFQGGPYGTECLYEGIWDTTANYWHAGRYFETATGQTGGGYGYSPNVRCASEFARTREHWVASDSTSSGQGGKVPDQPVGAPLTGDPEGTNSNYVLLGIRAAYNFGRTYYTYSRASTAAIMLYDNNRPSIISPIPASSSGWVDRVGDPLQVQRRATDSGLGVKYIWVNGPKINAGSPRPYGGNWDDQIESAHPCWGNRSQRCPSDYSASTLSLNLNQGVNNMSIFAADLGSAFSDAAPASASNAETHDWTQKVDNSAPMLELSGRLGPSGNSNPSGQPTLNVVAKDGTYSTTDLAGRRSGVQTLEVFANNQLVASNNGPCPSTTPDSCQKQVDWTLNPFDYTVDQINMKVVARDVIGATTSNSAVRDRHTTTQTWSVEPVDPAIDVERIACGKDEAPPGGAGATGPARQPDPCNEDSYGTHSWLDDERLETVAIARDGQGGRGVKQMAMHLTQAPAGPYSAQIFKTVADIPCPAGEGCPARAAHTFSTPASTIASLPEGVQDATVRVKSAGDTYSRVRHFPLRIDHQNPSVVPGVQSTIFETPPIGPLDTKTLALQASDNGAGVRSLEVFVQPVTSGGAPNGPERRVATWSQPCDVGCLLNKTFQFRGSDYAPGYYRIRARVTDHAGKAMGINGAPGSPQEKTYTVQVVGAPTPAGADRLGLEEYLGYDSTETGLSKAQTNLATGNLVWHKVPVVNPGRGLSTFVNLTYNSFDQPVGVTGAGPINPGVVSRTLGLTSYHEAGPGFSIGASGLTRLNEPLGMLPFARDVLAQPPEALRQLSSVTMPGSIALTDPDGTRHTFRLDTSATAERATLPRTGAAAFSNVAISYTPPPGVNLRLRLYNNPFDDLTAQGGIQLEALDRTWAITRPDGVTYFYDAWGYPTTIEDRNGNKITYEDELVNPLTGLGCPAVVPGACEPRVTGVVDPAGSDAAPGSDLRADRTVAIDYYDIPALQNPNQCLPVGGGAPTTWIDPVTACLGSGEAGKVKQITDHSTPAQTEGRKVLFEYNAAGFLTAVTEGAGEADRHGNSEQRTTRFDYATPDGDLIPPALAPVVGPLLPKQLSKVTDPRGSGAPDACPPGNSDCHSTRFAYEPFGNFETLDIGGVPLLPHRVDSVTNRAGNTRSYHYAGPEETEPSQLDRLLTPEQPSKATVTEPWQAQGQAVKSVYELDERSRPIAMTEAHGTSVARRTTVDYDTDNNPAYIVRAAGGPAEQATTYTYNANGLLLGRIDAIGRLTTFVYKDSAGMLRSELGIDTDTDAFVSDLTSQRRPRGNVWSYAYEPDVANTGVTTINGNLTDETDPAGTVTRMTYDTKGQVTAETRDYGSGRLNRKTTFADFDPSGLPQQVVDPLGNESGGNPAQHRWLYRYDAYGNVVKAVDPRGAGSMTQIPDEYPSHSPHTTTLQYNAFDQLEQETTTKCSLCDPVETVTRFHDYDRNGNAVRDVDGEGQNWDTAYGPMDLPSSETTPVGQTTRYDYDAGEHLVEVTSPRGVETGTVGDRMTRFELDALGRRIAATRKSNLATKDLITSFAYDARDNRVGVAAPRNNTDSSGATVSLATAILNASDPSRGKRRLTAEYNVVDELVANVEDPGGLGLRTEFRYDLNGNQVRQIAPRGFAGGAEPAIFSTFTSYDVVDRPLEVVDPVGSTTRYAYNRLGEMTSEERPNGVATPGVAGDFTVDYTYDANGALTSRSIPWKEGEDRLSNAALDAIKVTYTRDAVGDPVQITDGRGNSFNNSFFDTGELRSTGRPSWWDLDWQAGDSTNPDPGERFAAQAGGSEPDFEVSLGGPVLQEHQGPTGNAGADQIGAGGLPADPGPSDFGEANAEPLPGYLPDASQTTFQYDKEMRLRTVENGAGKQRTVGYDNAGRVVTKRWPFSENRDVIHRFEWDANNNLTKYTDENGCGNQSSEFNCVTTFTYDEFDRRSAEFAPGSKPGLNDPVATEETRFGYDQNGNLKARVTAEGGEFRFEYDAVDRLTSERNPVALPVERWTYEYDANGNRTSASSPLNVATRTEFDPADRMTKMIEASGTGVARSATFGYDANGNQVRTATPGATPAPGGSNQARITDTVFDGQDLPWTTTIAVGTAAERTTVTERDPNGNLRRVVNPKGIGPDRIPDVADTGNASDAARHANVGVYNADNQLIARHLPWSNVGPSHEPYGQIGPAELATTQPNGQDPWGINHVAENADRYRQEYTYEAATGFLKTITDTSGNPTSGPKTTYDSYSTGWVKQVSEPARSKTVDGVQVSIPARALTYDYDRRGNQTLWRTDGFRSGGSEDDRKIKRSFYPSGMLEERIGAKPTADPNVDADSRKYTYFYNRNRSLIATRDDLPPLLHGVDPAGPDIRTTTIQRDAAERQVAVNETWNSGGRDSTYSYDAAGNLALRKTELGSSNPKVTQFTYDAFDQETKMCVLEGSASPSDPCASGARITSTNYFPSGDVSSRDRTNSGADETLFWRADGQMARMERGTKPAVDYTYDPNGNRTRDERGWHAFNARDQLVLWKRDEDEPLGNGCTPTAGSEKCIVSYALDGNGSIRVKREQDATSTPIKRLTTEFTYLGDRLVRSKNENTTSTYLYDELGNATEVESTATGGVLPDPSPTPPANPTCNYSGWNKANTTYYCYDEFSRLVASKGPGLDDKPESYVYDGLDRRDFRISREGGGYRVRENSYVGMSQMLTREQRPAEGQGTATDVATYDYDSRGQRQGQRLNPAGGTTRYRGYRTDANGSVVALEKPDGTIGGSSDEYHFDPYGELQDPNPQGNTPADKELSTEAQENPFRFQSFYYDTAVKTYDMQARAYRPDAARFLSEDRYAAAGTDIDLEADPLTQNRYTFASGNPITRMVA